MRSESDDLTLPAEADVAREWCRRAERTGLARVMRASQPAALNHAVTEETRRILAECLRRGARDLRRPLRSVLEVGCGVGRLTPTIAAHAQSVTAIDMTSAMLEAARKNCTDVSNVELFRYRAEQFPWGNKRFDVSVCVWVLMHVLDEQQLAQVCHRLMAASRYLVLIEYEHARIPVSRWSRLRSLREYLSFLPGATVVHRRTLDYGGDRSTAALISFPPSA